MPSPPGTTSSPPLCWSTTTTTTNVHQQRCRRKRRQVESSLCCHIHWLWFLRYVWAPVTIPRPTTTNHKQSQPKLWNSWLRILYNRNNPVVWSNDKKTESQITDAPDLYVGKCQEAPLQEVQFIVNSWYLKKWFGEIYLYYLCHMYCMYYLYHLYHSHNLNQVFQFTLIYYNRSVREV